MKTKRERSSGELNGFLDAGSHIQGELRFEDTFRVEGHLTGRVVSNGDMVVGERGVVEGEIQAGRVYISGTVRGSIRAAQRIEVAAGAHVEADIDVPSLVIEDGAHFEGRCAMSRPGERAEDRPAVVARMPVSGSS